MPIDIRRASNDIINSEDYASHLGETISLGGIDDYDYNSLKLLGYWELCSSNGINFFYHLDSLIESEDVIKMRLLVEKIVFPKSDWHIDLRKNICRILDEAIENGNGIIGLCD